MGRISVYVPGDRAQDIEKWREKLNFSQIFMEAFDAALVREAQVSNLKGKKMKTVVERLKKQSSGMFEGGRKEGQKIGREWAAENATLSDLRAVGEGKLSFGPGDKSVRSFLLVFYRGQHEPYFESQDQIDASDPLYDSEIPDRGFDQGFVEGAREVWEQVKEAF